MRTALLLCGCILLSIVVWIVWQATSAPERVGQRTMAIDNTRHGDGTAEELALAPPERAETSGRTPAAATTGTITTFHVIDARSGADIERFDLQVQSVQTGGESGPVRPGPPRYERHAQGLTRALHSPGATFVVDAPGYESIRSRVHPNGATQTIRMQRSGGIEGRVTMDGRPALGVRIFAQRDHAGSASGASASYAFQVGQYSRYWSLHETDESGRFIVTGVAPGTYALRFEVPGAASVLRRGIVVPLELTVDIGEIVLAREAIVRGSIIPPADEPPSAIEVLLDGLTMTGPPPSTVDFEFRGLAAGTHELTWNRRDGADRDVGRELRRMQFDLQPGEVREVIVEAAGSTACQLTVRVRINGLPAQKCFVRATTELERPNYFPAPIAQTITDASGLAVLRMTPGSRLWIEVLGESMHRIGRTQTAIELSAGEERELTLDLALGTVVVQLPSSLATPASGQITLNLRDAQGHSIDDVASTTPNLVNFMQHPVWTTNRVEFGAYPAGEYTAGLGFAPIATLRGNPPDLAFDRKPLRAPFETRIEVIAGRETVIVVPE